MTHTLNEDVTPEAYAQCLLEEIGQVRSQSENEADDIHGLQAQLVEQVRENASQASKIQNLEMKLVALASQGLPQSQVDDARRDDDRAMAERHAMENADRDSVKAARCQAAMAELAALEKRWLDAKKEAAEAAASLKAEMGVRTLMKGNEIMGVPCRLPDRRIDRDRCIDHHRACSLKVKAADHALSAARKRHLHNDAMHFVSKPCFLDSSTQNHAEPL